MLDVTSASSFFGHGVYVSTNTVPSKTTQSDSSNQAEESDKVILSSGKTVDEQVAEYETYFQTNALLTNAKKTQWSSQLESVHVKLVKAPTSKPESAKPEPPPSPETKSEETRPQESSSTTSEKPPPEEPQQDLSLDYARVENEKARDAAARDFLTVGMSSRFVESQSATAS